MVKCSFCECEQLEDEFYMFSEWKMVYGKIKKSYVCKSCSDRTYGDKWYPITGYDQVCEISKEGYVRELKNNRYYDITNVQNAGVSYVYLTKNGKSMKKNIRSLLKRFVLQNKE